MKKTLTAGVLVLSVLFSNNLCLNAASYAENPESLKNYPDTINKNIQKNDLSPNYIKVADVALYQGKIEEITEDGILVGKLGGGNNGYDKIIFHTDENTTYNIEKSNLAVGQKVDIFYSGILTKSIPAQTTAIAINVLETEKDTKFVYDGKIIKVTNSKFGKRILVSSSDKKDKNKIIVFNITKDTKVKGGTLKNLKSGLKVKVTYGNAMTTSIPPQTTAISIDIQN